MEVKKFFKNVSFDEDTHTYTILGKKAGMSTTGLIHQYCKPFDEDKMSQLVANKNRKIIEEYTMPIGNDMGFGCEDESFINLPTTQIEVLEEWKYKSEYACERGNQVHLYAQGLWSGIPYETDFSKIEDRFLEQLRHELPILQKQALNFYNDYKDSYEFVEEEQFLYDSDYDLAGSIDLLLKNNYTGDYVIVDFKTYGDLNKKAYNKFLIPLHKFEDNNVNHLSFQLEVYKQMFERETKLIVGEMFGVWFNIDIDDYKIIEVNKMQTEIKKILEMRKIMARMILIMGEGGSGKTASLRNLKPKEHFYIDCDKKGLNFKGWRKDYNNENKNYYSTNDGQAILKMLKRISDEFTNIKYVTIDTINSVMIADESRRRKDKGYDKWQDLAYAILDIITLIPDLREDLHVILIGHTQTEEDGFVRLLTNGKKLNKIGLEKYFNTVLLAKSVDGEYFFETRANNSTARTPFGAFEELTIENDIVKILEILKEY